MLQYSEIIRKLIEAQRAMDAVAVLLHSDNTFNNESLSILNDMEYLKMSVEQQEVEEDDDTEE